MAETLGGLSESLHVLVLRAVWLTAHVGVLILATSFIGVGGALVLEVWDEAGYRRDRAVGWWFIVLGLALCFLEGYLVGVGT